MIGRGLSVDWHTTLEGIVELLDRAFGNPNCPGAKRQTFFAVQDASYSRKPPLEDGGIQRSRVVV